MNAMRFYATFAPPKVRFMTQPPLRVFIGSDVPTPSPEPPPVRVAMRDVVDALTDAARQKRGWIEDFADEEITISADLYDVIMAYQYFCKAAG